MNPIRKWYFVKEIRFIFTWRKATRVVKNIVQDLGSDKVNLKFLNEGKQMFKSNLYSSKLFESYT